MSVFYLRSDKSEAHRGHGVAGKLLDLAVDDMKSKGISPFYLVIDHTGFYERYGWESFVWLRVMTGRSRRDGGQVDYLLLGKRTFSPNVIRYGY